MTRVRFVLRADADIKPGGDVYQIRRYDHELRERGYASEVVLGGVGHPDDDLSVVHLSNVDRPVELMRDAMAAKRLGVPYVVSTIHHRARDVERFRQVRTGGLGVAERLLPKPGVDVGKHALRYGFKNWGRSPRVLWPNVAAVRSVLDGASRVICLSEAERRWLQEDFGYWSAATHIVPNGIDEPARATVSPLRDIDVIVVGRIERRKNQVAVAEALRSSGRSVLFLGAKNLSEPAYIRAFEDILGSDSGGSLSWHSAVPPQDVSNFYTRTKVAVSASFFEVLSLADLEAAACGCHVVASIAGGTEEALGQSAKYVDPWNLQDLSSVVGHLLEEPQPSPLRKYPGWAQVGQMLTTLYDDIGAG